MTEAFIGLDQSYSGFGFVVVNEVGEMIDQHLGVFPLDSYTGQGHRLLSVRNWLSSLYRDQQPAIITQICMEGYAPNAKFGREKAGELGGQVKVTTYSQIAVDPTIVTPTQVKKYATGKGSGIKKNQMLLAVYKRWSVEFGDDNLADAFVLAQIARALRVPCEVTKFQTEVLQQVRA